MAIICYNGKFVTTAKSLETIVAVVTRADCNSSVNPGIDNSSVNLAETWDK
jgi:hypothetical protein